MTTAHLSSVTRVKPRHSIGKLPVNLFASVMGLAGLALAWRQASAILGADPRIGETFGAIAVIAFAAIAAGYIAKGIRHPSVVVEEFFHPVSGNFFATIAIAMLLLSSVLAPYDTLLSQGVWLAGMILTFALSYVVTQRFLSIKQDAGNAVPSLLIPGVATLDIAVTGAGMPFTWARELNLFALAVGAVLALVLVVLIVSRLRHHDPLPLPMTPSLLVLVAPFEVGFLAYTSMTNRFDMVASVLFYFGLFLFLVLAPKVFRKSIPFGAPWWAVSFPMAALSIAALKYAAAQGGWGLHALAVVLLAALTGAIAVLFVRTVIILFNGKLLGAA
jgi:tellurite resistance protein